MSEQKRTIELAELRPRDGNRALRTAEAGAERSALVVPLVPIYWAVAGPTIPVLAVTG
jgi:hypothetical protein